ncbi:MFS transporter [Burkholderia multivorans]|uniref:MFS transporter n=1 Tax=Burkholderia multivorans TaxID=87883 RepID=UPI001C273F00|nr:MFS transporter [Burkholderia multivorans]MBU9597068.1 MFS transporter [Burkholderia multivorans]MDN7997030.1 MFS transporter [Burkholderia multivorans]WVN01566.1 MFS transporter [Burkholderia multivorans]
MNDRVNDARAFPGKFFLMALACAGGNSFSQMAAWLSPNILSGVLTSLHVSPSQGGALLAGEFLATSATAILLASYVSGVSFRRLAWIGAVLTLIGHFCSWHATSFTVMFALRVLAGIGEGAVSMAANSLAGEFERPDRLYGIMNLMAVLTGAIAMFALPVVQSRTGDAGNFIFLYVTVACVILLPTFWGFSGRNVPRAQYGGAGEGRYGWTRTLAWLACAVIPLASAPLYTFAVELGQGVRMDEGTVSNYLSLSILLSLLGTGFVATVGTRLLGRTLPMLVAISIAGCAVAWQATGAQAGFKAALLADMFAAYTAFPLLLGQLAEVDPSGRSSAIGVGLFGGAFAMGPLIAGTLVEYIGLNAVPYFSLCAYGVVLAVILSMRKAGSVEQYA